MFSVSLCCFLPLSSQHERQHILRVSMNSILVQLALYLTNWTSSIFLGLTSCASHPISETVWLPPERKTTPYQVRIKSKFHAKLTDFPMWCISRPPVASPRSSRVLDEKATTMLVYPSSAHSERVLSRQTGRDINMGTFDVTGQSGVSSV